MAVLMNSEFFESVYDEEQIRMIYEVGRPFEVPNALGSTLP